GREPDGVQRRGSGRGDAAPSDPDRAAALAAGVAGAQAARGRPVGGGDREAAVRLGVDGEDAHLEAVREARRGQPGAGADDGSETGSAGGPGPAEVLATPPAPPVLGAGPVSDRLAVEHGLEAAGLAVPGPLGARPLPTGRPELLGERPVGEDLREPVGDLADV